MKKNLALGPKGVQLLASLARYLERQYSVSETAREAATLFRHMVEAPASTSADRRSGRLRRELDAAWKKLPRSESR